MAVVGLLLALSLGQALALQHFLPTPPSHIQVTHSKAFSYFFFKKFVFIPKHVEIYLVPFTILQVKWKTVINF